MPINYTDAAYTSEKEALARKRKMIEALLAGAPRIESAGGRAIPISGLEVAGNLLAKYLASGAGEKADAEGKGIDEKYQSEMAQRLASGLENYDRLGAPHEAEGARPPDGVGPGVPMQAPGDPRAASMALIQSGHPMLQQMGTQAFMQQGKETPFGKVDPKDYTPESITRFAQTRNYADLVPMRAKEAVNLGGKTTFVDKYNPPAELAHTNTPDSLLTDARSRSEGALNRGVSVRGQDLTNARAADQNAIAGANKNVQLTEGIRKEFEGLPEVKSYKAVIPITESARKAPNTPAGDIDLIYAVGKVMDPGSVVREGELNLVIKAGSPAQKFQGLVNYVQGGGRLAPAQRKELMAALDNRVGEIKTQYDNAKNSYSTILNLQGIDPNQVFTTIGPQTGFKYLGSE